MNALYAGEITALASNTRLVSTQWSTYSFVVVFSLRLTSQAGKCSLTRSDYCLKIIQIHSFTEGGKNECTPVGALRNGTYFPSFRSRIDSHVKRMPENATFYKVLKVSDKRHATTLLNLSYMDCSDRYNVSFPAV